MIFRLEYCNKASVTARVDIQKGAATPVYTVEGTSEPFTLFYNNDKGDKSGSFRSSGADINIYETTEFNIDELKTSNETEISVKYYINNILNWSGFVIPDFFSETITGGQGVVSMVASDRLGTLKGATLSGLSAKVSNRALAEACLAQTGLSLPLYTMADFTGDGTNIFNSEVLSQRMVDTKGRNVSCYDILSSILEETNSLIVQRNGAWYIVNKLQLEAGSGSLYSAPATSSAWAENTVSFDEVSVGARRTITPVAATVGVYHEHGGGRLHPDNYDFSGGSTGWVKHNGFDYTIVDEQILGYELIGGQLVPKYGASDKNRLLSNNVFGGSYTNIDTAKYVSNTFPVVTTSDTSVKVEVDMSIILAPTTAARAMIVADNGTDKLAFNPSQGAFQPYDPEEFQGGYSVFFINIRNTPSEGYTANVKYSATLEATNVQDYNISIRFYGSDVWFGSSSIFIDFASVKFSNTAEAPKGSIFKTEQGANYTKNHDIPTVLWGDYLTLGLNGYFYSYPIDDTSSLYRPTGELHSRWTAYGDPDTLPLLQHITRQKARMFSVAHDLLSAEIATSTFDPLSVFVDCDSTRYVVVSARFDFLRSNVSVELEEVEYITNSKRDYIYSYFGDGEEGISSIGGISGGTTSTGGGGMTTEQLEMLTNLASWWKLDEVNDAIYSEKNVYSQQDVSAYGIGSGGSGGGGDISKLPSWAGYTPAMVDYYVSAGLLVPFYNDMQARVSDLEGGVPPTQHNHTIGEIAGLQDALDGKASSTHNHNTVYEPKNVNIQAHISSTSNPHGVTASQVGSYTIAQTNTSITNAISAIEIGGRNLLLDSWGDTRSDGLVSRYALSSKIENGENFVVRIKVKENTSIVWGNPDFYTQVIDGVNNQIRIGYLTEVSKGLWELKGTWDNKTGDTIEDVTFFMRGGSRPDFEVEWAKLEKGNKATDWTPAPEDVDASIALVQTNLNTHASNSVTNVKHLTDAQLSYLNNLIDWWQLDEFGNLYTEKNLYSQQNVSAYGVGSGGGGGTDISKLLSWSGYTSAMADYYAPASLLVPFYNDMQSRVGAIENTDYAELDSSGKVLSSQLPSYVDDVIEAASLSAFPLTGESGKIYIAQDTNRTYRWSGTAYTEISASLALGETSSTAYRGDRGKAAYDHSQVTGNPHGVTASQVGSYTIAQTDTSITNAISAIEIGGRNLILDSKGPHEIDTGRRFNLSENLVDGKVYTISLVVDSVISGEALGNTINVRQESSSSAIHLGMTRVGNSNYFIGTGVFYGTNNYLFINSGEGYADSQSRILEISKLKLEKGNKATDWTPAPEDVDAKIILVQTNLNTHTLNTSNPHAVTKAQVGLGNVLNVASYSKTESDTALELKLNKSVFDDLFEKVEVSTGVYAIKAKYSFYSTGEVSAYGIGTGGSGGGIDISKLQSWAGYTSAMADYYVPASLLVPFYNDYNGHGHDISDVNGLQSALDGKVDDSQVLTNVPLNAKFTDTIYTHPSHTARTSGLYKITVNSLGHVTGATAVVKTDITALGIPAQDTTYGLATTSANGLMSATDKVKLNGIATGATANTGTVTSVGLSVPTGLSVSGTPITTSGTLSISLASGYSIPTTAKQTNWDSAYGWGDYRNYGIGRTTANVYTGGDVDVPVATGLYSTAASSTANTPNFASSGSLVMLQSGASGNEYKSQIWIKGNADTNNQLFFRHRRGSSGWNSWDEIYHTGNLTSLSQLTDNIGVGTHISNTSNPHSVTKSQVGLSNVDNTADSAKNVLSATKLTTARTIWGQSFDGSGNVSGAITGATTGNFTGSVTANNLIISSTAAEKNISFMRPSYNYLTADTVGGSLHFITNGDGLTISNSILGLFNNGNVGIGKGFSTVNPTAQLEVRGTGTFTGNVTAPTITASTSVTTPKVIFSAAGWSLEQVGTELQMKHNGVVKQRMLSDGSIVATGEVTAFVSAT